MFEEGQTCSPVSTQKHEKVEMFICKCCGDMYSLEDHEQIGSDIKVHIPFSTLAAGVP